MSEKTYIGIDNGVTGSIAILGSDRTELIQTPTFSQQNYTKTKQNITRLDFTKVMEILKPFESGNVIAILERPMVNPTRFKATISAVRCLESLLCCLELLKIPYQYIDSKEWQKAFFPAKTTSGDTKRLSFEVANRLFPTQADIIKKQKDGDALLIAEYARRKNL